MKIIDLALNNFRNYQLSEFQFDENTNVLFGDNAQGKTNVLEAIFVAATTKSHKSSKDREMINMDANESHIRMHVEKRERVHKIDIHLKKSGSKGIAIDGIPIKASSELIGLCNIIFFSPEDLGIIKNGPSERRRFIDIELCQLDKMYLHDLSKYNKILAQRNNLLKQINEKRDLIDTLDIWDMQLVEYGKKVIKRRNDFLLELQTIIEVIHNKLSGGREILFVEYEPNSSEELLDEKLFLARDRDIFQGTTSVGPHRDDISFKINGQDIRKYGSQGQQRTTALSLKMAEIEIVKKAVGETPVLLLDDVLSELDRKRQNYLLENIKGIQTLVTCTGLEEFVQNGINIDKTFEIENGSIKE